MFRTRLLLLMFLTLTFSLSAETGNPLPFRLGTVSGFADYHAHQTGQLGFDGRFFLGSHTGSESHALGGCNGHNHAISWGPEIVGQLIKQPDMTRHTIRTNGYNSNSAKSYKQWPIWQTTTHQGYWKGHLKKAHDAGMGLYVMSAVNFDMICKILPKGNRNGEVSADVAANPVADGRACSDMENVTRQLRAVHAFAAENSWVEIAQTPDDAAYIINQGKLAVVLAVEADRMWGASDNDDWDDVLDRLNTLHNLGVVSYQLTHEIDNNIGGAALFMGLWNILSAIEKHEDTLIPALLAFKFGQVIDMLKDGMQKDSRGHNTMGLTPVGKQLVQELINRKLIIDISHLSERGVNDVYDISVQNSYYPMFLSHAHYRELFTESTVDEKKVPSYTVKKIIHTGGVIGLRTGQERVKTYNPAGVANNCHGSSRSFAQSYLLGALGYGVKQGFGVDMTGGIAQIRPRFYAAGSKWSGTIGVNAPITWACGGTKVKDFRKSGQTAQGSRSSKGLNNDFDLIGFGHIGHIKNVILDLNKLGVDTNQLEDSAEHFLSMWDRAYDSSRQKVSADVSTSGIDHTSYTDACPMAVPLTGPRREQVGTKFSGTKDGMPVYRSICKAWPHTNIQRHNCSGYGSVNGSWCIKSRNDGKWFSARQIIEDKCPVPHFKINGVYKDGKIVCLSSWDTTIQRRNCSGSGKYKWGNYCVVASSSYHYRVRNLVRDLCPVPMRYTRTHSDGKILCKPTPHFKIRSRKCDGGKWGGFCIWNKGYYYKARELK